jgi:hypothetical protein
MFTKIKLVIFVFLFFIITVPSFYLINSQTITIKEKKVVYELPYPGLLPDHPLYFLKATRDKFLEIITRDNVKKAEFYLHLSDKKANAATFLVKKGKNKLAVETIASGEKHASKISDLLTAAKNQGASATPAFIDRVKLSNTKHREIIEQLLKEIPSGDQTDIEEVVKLNEKIRRDLERL